MSVTEKLLPEKLSHTVDEVGHMLGLGRTTMYQLIRRKELGCVRVGRRIIIPHESVVEFLKQRD